MQLYNTCVIIIGKYKTIFKVGWIQHFSTHLFNVSILQAYDSKFKIV